MSKNIKEVLELAEDKDVSIEITVTINGFRKEHPFNTRCADHINSMTIKTTDRSTASDNYVDSWIFLKKYSQVADKSFDKTIAEYINEDIKRLEENRND